MWPYIFWGIIILIGILLIVILLVRLYQPSGFSNIQNGTQKLPELMFFYANWCPHCKIAKVEWTKTQEYLDATNINSSKVYCIEHNCSEKTTDVEQTMNEYKIEGFPTIKLQYNNIIHDFNDTVTKDNIVAFLNKIIT